MTNLETLNELTDFSLVTFEGGCVSWNPNIWTVSRTTEKAILINDEWIPKSQILDVCMVEKKKYDSEGNFEIVSCSGNISLKESEIFVHAHIVLADDKSQCFGGHLMPGCILFAGEYYIQELAGGKFRRKYDPETGLALW